MRARPLSEAAPELGRYMANIAHTPPTKHITAAASTSVVKPETDADCIGYDELMLLVRRFRSEQKGRIQYSGKLLNLLDVPSMPALEKRLVTA